MITKNDNKILMHRLNFNWRVNQKASFFYPPNTFKLI